MTETELMRQIGDNIQSALEDSRMSQKELSDETGIDKSTISRYIAGTCIPSLKNLVNIANALYIPIEELVDADERIEK